jgi:hypothetical protein
VGTNLEEVQIASESCGGWVVVLHRHLTDHDNDDADERRERQQHRRENTRESPDFAHGCGCVLCGSQVFVVVDGGWCFKTSDAAEPSSPSRRVQQSKRQQML